MDIRELAFHPIKIHKSIVYIFYIFVIVTVFALPSLLIPYYFDIAGNISYIGEDIIFDHLLYGWMDVDHIHAINEINADFVINSLIVLFIVTIIFHIIKYKTSSAQWKWQWTLTLMAIVLLFLIAAISLFSIPYHYAMLPHPAISVWFS